MTKNEITTVEELLTQIEALVVPSNGDSSLELDRAALILKLKKATPNASAETIGLAVETFIARRVAVKKLGSWAAKGFFSAALVEQASQQTIASYRARYFLGLRHVLEVGTGTGSDTAALARVCARVTTVESDPTRAALAERNLAIQGITNVTFVIDDITRLRDFIDLNSFDGFYADPARRTETGKRVKDALQYSPPLLDMLSLTNAQVRAIKVSPGLFFDAPHYGWSRQFVGYGDECLEQTLWYGAPIVDSSVYLADTDTAWSPAEERGSEPPRPERLAGFVSEAHGCVNRSQHLGQFFSERGIHQISPEVSYGISEREPAPSPLLTSFCIIDAFPFTVERLSETIRSMGWTNRTEIKKRNFPQDPEAIRAALRLPVHFHNGPFGTILLFTWHRKPWAIVARRCGT